MNRIILVQSAFQLPFAGPIAVKSQSSGRYTDDISNQNIALSVRAVVNSDDGGLVMRFRMSALIVVALVCSTPSLQGCGDEDGGTHPTATATPTPRPTQTVVGAMDQFAGVYDLHSASDLMEFSGEAVAVVEHSDGADLALRFEFDAFDELDVRGSLIDRGMFSLAGFGFFQADIGVQVAGEATVSIENVVQRVSGSLHNPDPESFVQFDVTFAMERPESGTPATIGGRYAFEFDPSPSGCQCSSSAILDVDVPATGRGQVLRAAHDVDASGALLGVVEPGNCLVSPTGRLQCVVEYLRVFEPPEDPFSRLPPDFLITLSGQLTGVGGSGRTDVDPLTALFFGAWTARR